MPYTLSRLYEVKPRYVAHVIQISSGLLHLQAQLLSHAGFAIGQYLFEAQHSYHIHKWYETLSSGTSVWQVVQVSES